MQHLKMGDIVSLEANGINVKGTVEFINGTHFTLKEYIIWFRFDAIKSINGISIISQ